MQEEIQPKITEEELHQYCNSIRINIAKDRIKKAFQETKVLVEKIDDPVNRTRLIRLQNRYSSYKEIARSGIRSHAENDLLKNQITYDFLGFLSEINLSRRLKINQENIEDIQLQVQKLGAKLSLNVEIIKERISKLGECWGAIYSFENYFFKVIDSFLNDYVDFSGSSEELNTLKKVFQQNRNLNNLHLLLSSPEIKAFYSKHGLSSVKYTKHLKDLDRVFKKYEKADIVLEKSRFWMGRDIYQEARIYHDCYPRFYEKFKNKDYIGCLKCLEHQQEAAVSIEEIIIKLQEEVF
jgi:hypothetical protein